MKTYVTGPKETPSAAPKAQQPSKAPQAGATAPSPVTWQASSVRLPPVFGNSAGVLKVLQLKGNRAVSQMLAVQQSAEAQSVREPSDAEIHSAAAEGIRTPATSLPYLDRIQASFGRHSLGHVKAHVGPEAAKASRAMSALAFASGDHVVFGGTPVLRTAAHEAAHIVQQRVGVQLTRGIGREGDAYERQADAIADTVVAGGRADELLDSCLLPISSGQISTFTPNEVQRQILTNAGQFDREATNDFVSSMINSSEIFLIQTHLDVNKIEKGEGKSKILSPDKHVIGEEHAKSRFEEACKNWGWGARRMVEDLDEDDSLQNKNITMSDDLPLEDTLVKELAEVLWAKEALRGAQIGQHKIKEAMLKEQGESVVRKEFSERSSWTNRIFFAVDKLSPYSAFYQSTSIFQRLQRVFKKTSESEKYTEKTRKALDEVFKKKHLIGEMADSFYVQSLNLEKAVVKNNYEKEFQLIDKIVETFKLIIHDRQLLDFTLEEMGAILGAEMGRDMNEAREKHMMKKIENKLGVPGLVRVGKLHVDNIRARIPRDELRSRRILLHDSYEEFDLRCEASTVEGRMSDYKKSLVSG